MREADQVGRQATKEITRWLKMQPQTLKVINVEAHPDYQRKDVDLIWRTRRGEITIEVKGDRQDQTGNFFFETLSNKQAGTPGCFLYTEADFLYYYFVGLKKLYILPMPATRDWFNARLKTFRETSTTTPCAGGFYTTVGRLVKIERVVSAMPDVRVVELKGSLDRACWWRSLAALLSRYKCWK